MASVRFPALLLLVGLIGAALWQAPDPTGIGHPANDHKQPSLDEYDRELKQKFEEGYADLRKLYDDKDCFLALLPDALRDELISNETFYAEFFGEWESPIPLFRFLFPPRFDEDDVSLCEFLMVVFERLT